MERSARGVQCLDRAMDIMEAIGGSGELGVSELAGQVGLHVATVHNILRTLAARHYLINTSGRYRLGPAMAALTSRWEPLQALPTEVKPYLERISVETGEAASASILVGYEARLVGFQPGTQPITIHYPQWEWPNAMSLATGRLLVALGPESLWPEFITRNAGAEPYWSPERWTRELTQLREDGCCVLRGQGESGQTAIGFPVRTIGDQAIAAIGASAPGFRADATHCDRMVATLHAVSTEFSQQLGWHGPGLPPPHFNWS